MAFTGTLLTTSQLHRYALATVCAAHELLNLHCLVVSRHFHLVQDDEQICEQVPIVKHANVRPFADYSIRRAAEGVRELINGSGGDIVANQSLTGVFDGDGAFTGGQEENIPI